MPSISARERPASAIASSAALLMRSSEDKPSCLPYDVSPTPVMKVMGATLLPLVIPGRSQRVRPVGRPDDRLRDEPEIHSHDRGLWIPGLRQEAHPGMTSGEF